MHLNTVEILDASLFIKCKGLTASEVICNFHFEKFLLKLKPSESEVCNEPVVCDENNV